jgi:peptidoglycan/LPS O-acetylase OafA/YrhL
LRKFFEIDIHPIPKSASSTKPFESQIGSITLLKVSCTHTGIKTLISKASLIERESFTAIALVFPFVVYLGASGETGSAMGAKLCNFLGAISYPLYIIHYPFIYTDTAWVAKTKTGPVAALPVLVPTYLACVAVAWVCLRFYDIPVRRWLARRGQLISS